MIGRRRLHRRLHRRPTTNRAERPSSRGVGVGSCCSTFTWMPIGYFTGECAEVRIVVSPFSHFWPPEAWGKGFLAPHSITVYVDRNALFIAFHVVCGSFERAFLFISCTLSSESLSFLFFHFKNSKDVRNKKSSHETNSRLDAPSVPWVCTFSVVGVK